MNTTINFGSKLLLWTVEIDHESTNWILTPESAAF